MGDLGYYGNILIYILFKKKKKKKLHCYLLYSVLKPLSLYGLYKCFYFKNNSLYMGKISTEYIMMYL